ncbi:MAG: Uma2 family endonuclease [Leptolyngbyaceae cyanobacterium]
MTYTKKLTFEDYLALPDTGLEERAELIDGELVELPPESGINLNIAALVYIALVNVGIPYFLVQMGRCEVQTPVLEPGDAVNRYPDVVVLQPEHQALTRQRMTITLEMPPPRWVMEVVRPGKLNRERDYLRKRSQYAAVGIPEYWIVDPEEAVVLVLRLENGRYREAGRYQGNQRVGSPIFPELNLTAEQIFTAGQ